MSWEFLISLSVLLVNDFYLKPHHPSALSGILSDLAGMVFFPILIVAFIEFALALVPRSRLASPLWFAWSTVCVGAMFIVVKFSAVGEAAYVAVVGPLTSLSVITPGIDGSGVVSDPWDIMAFVTAPVPYLVGRTWRRRPGVSRPNG